MNKTTPRILTLVGAATLCLAACAAPGDQHLLVTEHATALVQTERLDDGALSSTVLGLDGAAELATAVLSAAADGASVVFADGRTLTLAQLPDGLCGDPTGWNHAVYSAYQLGTWLDSGGEVGYCHTNAAGVGCRGACGKGCNSCTKSFVCAPNSKYCGGAGANLIWFEVYSCYTRPCCAAHDACYDACAAAGRGFWCRRGCDWAASKSGCSMKDARGKTGGAADATPLAFQHPTGIPCTVDGAVADELPKPAEPAEPVGVVVEAEPVVDHESGRECVDEEEWQVAIDGCPDQEQPEICVDCIWGN